MGESLAFRADQDHYRRMTATLAPPGRQEAAAEPPGRSKALIVVVAVIVAAVAVLATAFVASLVARHRADVEAGIQHHRGLALAASSTLSRDLNRALRQPVAARPASSLPWLDGPQLGPGPVDAMAQGSPRIATWLVRSAPDAVVGRTVVISDGYRTVVVEKWSAGETSTDDCSYTDLPSPWNSGTTEAMCQKLIDSVPDP
jgi:hypothetical protein